MTFALSEPHSIERLQVVYKLAERCNLNCSYCYYYHLGDHTALTRPALAPLSATTALAHWLAQGCAELDIPQVRVSFHGGEPMLQPDLEFARACNELLRVLSPVANLQFSIQTNGTLMTAGWVEALKRYEVNVGVSIDGRRADHDRFRVDHQGRSSFDATEATIECLVKESDRYPWLRPSTISVLHRDADYRGTYSYLRGLGVRSMHFLLPDRNADASISEDEAAALGRGLLAVFEAWLTEDDPDINIRFISEMLGHLQIGRSQAPLRRHRKHNQIIVARSDATIAIDDSLIPALGWYREAQAFPIARHTLRDVLGDPIFGMLDAERSRLPEGCQGCQWTQVCGGGDLENRYSAARAFNNPSVYCDTYKTLYQGICRTLVENGYPPSELALRFGVPEFA